MKKVFGWFTVAVVVCGLLGVAVTAKADASLFPLYRSSNVNRQAIDGTHQSHLNLTLPRLGGLPFASGHNYSGN
ncbi:hypothetical protein [Levilactobacillus suantsaii]|uniref:Uncharacterized protein n=1 Tax=Levilactobacillus suantsaii TaxID=2292255 RepID=A0A4Q0VHL5_9LACO|nr:hypothetical protein [Levilactobacillus suantsaii]QMU08322.1 hypothetical protein H3M12_01185 [Levilactobacillus suantsaii]RXI78738.1 hypothetical protein DXH47_05735 [Levilactobacillus suantsaii]